MSENGIKVLILSQEAVQAISNILYDTIDEKEGGKCFYVGCPRKTEKDFFDDVKRFLGDHCGEYICNFEYKDKEKPE